MNERAINRQFRDPTAEVAIRSLHRHNLQPDYPRSGLVSLISPAEVCMATQKREDNLYEASPEDLEKLGGVTFKPHRLVSRRQIRSWRYQQRLAEKLRMVAPIME